ncbi:trigger factor [Patescibacteria group bacterium]
MITSTIAKQEDGSIQINFVVPFSEIKQAQDKTIAEYAKEAEIPGFRKGKAPVSKVAEKIPQNTLIEKSLAQILPKALSDAIKKHDIKPAIYPRFELISAKENQDWQIRAVTCELPKVELGDYKKIIPGEIRAASLKKELSKEEKEQLVIKTLLESTKINIPSVLVEEEVNSRLSSLLSRLEKLGLALEGYLKSLGKTSDQLRDEYEKGAKDAISLDLILNKVVEDQDIQADPKQVEEALKLRKQANPKEEDREGQKRLVESILRRNSALEKLVNLS